MSAERWIVIPRWDGEDGFQHYKDREPIWIKNYRRLLHDGDYLRLTLHQRGVLHGLWLEYAAANRQIPDSTLTVSRRLGGRVSRATLDALNHAGFIEYSASKPLALRYQDASPEKEKSKRTPQTPLAGESQPPVENGAALNGKTKRDLRKYTGCRVTRGSMGQGWKRDVLGLDEPPKDWPYPKPTEEQVVAAIKGRPS